MTQDQKEIQAIKAAGYNGYSKCIHSQCKRPDKYGIMRTPGAESAIAPQPARAPRKDKRKLAHKHTFRLSEIEQRQFKQAFRESSAKTEQDFVRMIVVGHIKNNAASDAGTSKAANEKIPMTTIKDEGEIVNADA